MKKNSIKLNYIYNLGYKIITGIIPLVMAAYVSRILGPDGVGEISFALSINSYFVLMATLGITTHGCKEISYYQDNTEERTIAFWEIKIIEFCSSFFILVIYLIYALLAKSLLHVVLAFNILAVFVDVTWFFQGIEDFKRIVTRNTIVKISNIAFVFLFVNDERDVLLYAFFSVFFAFLANLVFWIEIKKYLARIKIKQIHPLRQVKPIISLFIPTIAVQVYTVLDKTMLGAITHTNSQNGYYEQASVIVMAVLSFVTALGTVVMPRIGYYFKKGDMLSVNRLMYKAYKFIMVSTIPMTFGIIATADKMIPWFLGSDFIPVIPIIRVLSFLIIFIALSNMTGIQYLIPTNQQNILTISVVFGAVINLMINFVLIPLYGALGAGIASLIAEFSVMAVQFWFVRNQIFISEVLKNSYKCLIAGIIMLLLVYVESRFLKPDTISVAIMIMTGVVIYTFILVILRESFVLSIYDMIKNKMLLRRQE